MATKKDSAAKKFTVDSKALGEVNSSEDTKAELESLVSETLPPGIAVYVPEDGGIYYLATADIAEFAEDIESGYFKVVHIFDMATGTAKNVKHLCDACMSPTGIFDHYCSTCGEELEPVLSDKFQARDKARSKARSKAASKAAAQAEANEEDEDNDTALGDSSLVDAIDSTPRSRLVVALGTASKTLYDAEADLKEWASSKKTGAAGVKAFAKIQTDIAAAKDILRTDK